MELNNLPKGTWIALDTTGRDDDRDIEMVKVFKSRKKGEGRTYELHSEHSFYTVNSEKDADRLHVRPEGAYSNRFDVAEVNPNLTEFAEQAKNFDRFDRIQFDRFAWNFTDVAFWKDVDSETPEQDAAHWVKMVEIVSGN